MGFSSFLLVLVGCFKGVVTFENEARKKFQIFVKYDCTYTCVRATLLNYNIVC